MNFSPARPRRLTVTEVILPRIERVRGFDGEPAVKYARLGLEYRAALPAPHCYYRPCLIHILPSPPPALKPPAFFSGKMPGASPRFG